MIKLHAFQALGGILLAASCARPAPVVVPQEEPVEPPVPAEAANLASGPGPADLLLPSSLALLPSQNGAGNGGGSQAEPTPGPKIKGLPEAKGELLAFTASVPGSKEGRLFIWDEVARDAYAVPAVGTDIGTGGIYRKTKLLFERPTGGLFSYDFVTEQILEMPNVNEIGFTTRGSITGDGLLMSFMANPDGKGGIRPESRPYLWVDGVVGELVKLTEVGKAHGGVARVRLAGGGKLATFVTQDGGLFLYGLESGLISEVTEARDVEDGFSHHPVLESDGRKLAWVSGRKSPQRIYLSDVAAVPTPGGPAYATVGKPRLLVEANDALGSPVVTGPKFGSQGRIYFEAFIPDLGVFKAFRYDPLRGVQTLTVLNATIPDESTIYTGTGVP